MLSFLNNASTNTVDFSLLDAQYTHIMRVACISIDLSIKSKLMIRQCRCLNDLDHYWLP